LRWCLANSAEDNSTSLQRGRIPGGPRPPSEPRGTFARRRGSRQFTTSAAIIEIRQVQRRPERIGSCRRPRILIPIMPCHFSLSEASIERLRKFLLPLELAEAELRAKPAAAVMILLREGGQGLEVLLGERRQRAGDTWSGQVGLPGGRHHEEDGTSLSTAIRE